MHDALLMHRLDFLNQLSKCGLNEDDRATPFGELVDDVSERLGLCIVNDSKHALVVLKVIDHVDHMLRVFQCLQRFHFHFKQLDVRGMRRLANRHQNVSLP